MSSIASRPVQVEHVTISCDRRFDEVVAALASLLPAMDAELTRLLRTAQEEEIASVRDHGPALYLFLTRDHGALLASEGMAAKANQYEIGNQITAASMTRWNLGAGLYVPLRVVLYEDAQGRARFEYDLPSSLLSQFGDRRVTEVGLDLDAKLEALLIEAAG